MTTTPCSEPRTRAAVLPDTETPSKMRKLDGLDGPELHVEAAQEEGVLVIRLGLGGIHSVQILADESVTEEALLSLLRLVRPALEEAVGACKAEPVGIGRDKEFR